MLPYIAYMDPMDNIKHTLFEVSIGVNSRIHHGSLEFVLSERDKGLPEIGCWFGPAYSSQQCPTSAWNICSGVAATPKLERTGLSKNRGLPKFDSFIGVWFLSFSCFDKGDLGYQVSGNHVLVMARCSTPKSCMGLPRAPLWLPRVSKLHYLHAGRKL